MTLIYGQSDIRQRSISCAVCPPNSDSPNNEPRTDNEQRNVENFFGLCVVHTIYFCIFAKNKQNVFVKMKNLTENSYVNFGELV
jgi:hypothetical protein